MFIKRIAMADKDETLLLKILNRRIGLKDFFSFNIKIETPITPAKSINLPKSVWNVENPYNTAIIDKLYIREPFISNLSPAEPCHSPGNLSLIIPMSKSPKGTLKKNILLQPKF